MNTFCDFRKSVASLVPMSTASDRVRSLIQESDLSQGDFAHRIGLDDSKLSKTLSGHRRFSSLDLARIADEFEVSVDWLLNGKESELALAARSTGGSAASAIAYAKRLDTLRSDMAYLGFAQPWEAIPARPSSGFYVRDGEDLARAAHARLKSKRGSGADPHLTSCVESVFGVDVAVVDLDDDFDGLAVASEDTRLILLATSAVPARQRFTLAHELGHLLADDDQRIHVDQDVYGEEHKADLSEKRANAFAAAFLMPEEVLTTAVRTTGLDDETFAGLALDLCVSPSALAYRLANCGLIDSARRDELRKVTGPMAARLARRNRDYAALISASSTPRPPGLLLRDTYTAYESGKATLRPYADLIGVSTDALRRDLEVGDLTHIQS